MRLLIHERLRPFSHLPGTSTILPGSIYEVQIFPCLIRIYRLAEALPVLITELELNFRGPIEQFTVCNDLERGRIAVWGKTTEGWMRYYLVSAQNSPNIRLFIDKAPSQGVIIEQSHQRMTLQAGEWLDILEKNLLFQPYQMPICDRLFLGNHKALDWEMVKRRLQLNEILPIWHRLGQLIPSYSVLYKAEGNLKLLNSCREDLWQERRKESEQLWLNLILTGFRNLLVPCLEDFNYQGMIPNQPLKSLDISPLVILTEGARLIRQLFIQQEEDMIYILPHLFISLHCGRLLDVPIKKGTISLEWSKKTIRRLILHSDQEQELKLLFPSRVESYRFRRDLIERGERKSCPSSLVLNKNCYYYFDNFK